MGALSLCQLCRSLTLSLFFKNSGSLGLWLLRFFALSFSLSVPMEASFPNNLCLSYKEYFCFWLPEPQDFLLMFYTLILFFLTHSVGLWISFDHIYQPGISPGVDFDSVDQEILLPQDPDLLCRTGNRHTVFQCYLPAHPRGKAMGMCEAESRASSPPCAVPRVVLCASLLPVVRSSSGCQWLPDVF